MSDQKSDQPKSMPREQRGESKPIGPGPAGEEQTDDQDNLHNNVSDLGVDEGAKRPPTEPADPHPSDEDRDNVYNPAPGGDRNSEQKDRSVDRLRKDPGSPA